MSRICHKLVISMLNESIFILYQAKKDPFWYSLLVQVGGCKRLRYYLVSWVFFSCLIFDMKFFEKKQTYISHYHILPHTLQYGQKLKKCYENFFIGPEEAYLPVLPTLLMFMDRKGNSNQEIQKFKLYFIILPL